MPLTEEGHLYSGHIEQDIDTNEMDQWIQQVNERVRKQRKQYLHDFIEYVNKCGYGSAYDVNELVDKFLDERSKKKDEGSNE